MTDFYSVKDVAAKLKIRPHSVLALIKSGSLVACDLSLNPGGRPTWRISAERLENFILRRTHQSSTPRKRRHKRPSVKQYF